MSYEGQLRGDGLRVAIACARFNDLITERLLTGARDALLRHGVDEASITVAWVSAKAGTGRSPGDPKAVLTSTFQLPSGWRTMMRSDTPLQMFERWVLEDIEVHGVPIPRGSEVALLFGSANRDPSVFNEPDRLDVARTDNPHLSFGIAGHFCLGVHLARLEGKVFFEELLATFPTIELTDEPVRVRSNLNNAYKKVPLRLS